MFSDKLLQSEQCLRSVLRPAKFIFFSSRKPDFLIYLFSDLSPSLFKFYFFKVLVSYGLMGVSIVYRT